MQYRRFGRLDWQGSALCFSAIRLPLTDANPANVDESEAIRMLRYAIDHGVNYVDNGYVYYMGRGEVVVGKALQDGYRDKVKLTTKLPPLLVNSLADCDRCLNEQLQRLQTDRLDFYLFHGLRKESCAHPNERFLKWGLSPEKYGG